MQIQSLERAVVHRHPCTDALQVGFYNIAAKKLQKIEEKFGEQNFDYFVLAIGKIDSIQQSIFEKIRFKLQYLYNRLTACSYRFYISAEEFDVNDIINLCKKLKIKVRYIFERKDAY